MYGEQRPVGYFAHAQIDLNLRTLRMFEGNFACGPVPFEGLRIFRTNTVIILHLPDRGMNLVPLYSGTARLGGYRSQMH